MRDKVTLKNLQKSKQERQSYSQKQSLGLEPDSTTLNAIFLDVFIQASEYPARPTTSASDEHRCSIHCESFWRQLIHVGDVFQARYILFKKNLMRFKQL